MFVPALKTPVAKPSSFFGNHSATLLILAGKTPASPNPRQIGDHKGGERMRDRMPIDARLQKTIAARSRCVCQAGLSNGPQKSSRARRPSETRTPDSRSRSRSAKLLLKRAFQYPLAPAGPCSSWLHREIRARRRPSEAPCEDANFLWAAGGPAKTSARPPIRPWRSESLPASAPFGLIRSLTCDPQSVQIRLVEIPAEYSRHQTAGLHLAMSSHRPQKSDSVARNETFGDTRWASAPRRPRELR